MSRINILDENTANKIAAGEVVERPSSVVKELIENSIDAKAKNITVEIENGGIDLIRIIDDGVGIVSEDVEKAFMPHATSKISCVEDIYSIATLGFRGEALPSIASVSKLTFRTRTMDSDFGTVLVLDGGRKIECTEVGMNAGSIIEVRDLFFNVPARKKFLKSISREGSLITDIVTRIALSNIDVSIKFYNNGKKILQTFGDGNLSNAIRTIYGRNISDHILEFKSKGDNININGYIGKEIIARGSRNNQSIFVNNRYIKNRTITAAVENAFKSFSTVNKFPFFALFINVDANSIDVNIHPTKAEIKFDNDRIIFKSIFDAVHTTLRNDVFDSFSEDENKYKPETIEELKLEIKEEEDLSFKARIYEENIEPIKKIEPSIDNVYNSIAIEDINREENLYKKLKEMNSTYVKESAPKEIYYDTSVKASEASYTVNNKKDDVDIQKENKNDFEMKQRASAKFPSLRTIGQFNKTYILAENDNTLYIIDQHAAHEKILYEKYLKQIIESELIVQPVLIPTLIDLTIDEYECYIENKKTILDAGFIVEEFGGNTVAIKEVPYFIGKLDCKNLFLEIINNLMKLGSGKTEEVKLNKIASMACRKAVKANDSLTILEMDKLINDLRYIDNPFHCPHGRPVIIKFTEYEMDRKFRRIV